MIRLTDTALAAIRADSEQGIAPGMGDVQLMLAELAQLKAVNFDYQIAADADKGKIERLKSEVSQMLNSKVEQLLKLPTQRTESYEQEASIEAVHKEVKRLKVENEKLLKLLNRMVDQHVPLTELEGVPGWSRVVELVDVTAERDALKAENVHLKNQEIEVRAECEGLRVDAGRYRWLRDSSQYDWNVSYGKLEIRIATPHIDSSDLDACIDAAMSKGKQS